MTKLYVCEISNLIKELKADEKALDTYFDKLGRMRMEHILKHNKVEDRARTLGASLLLLFALQKEGYAMTQMPDFAFMGKGKPYIPGLEQVYFNLSHTKNMITCAISESEMGVDVEHIREIKQTTINRVFSEKEKQMAGNSMDGYVRLWTMKEACAKLVGTGLAEILDGLEISNENEQFYIEKLNRDIRKTSRYLIIAEGHVSDASKYPYYYSVCAYDKTDVEIVCTKWDKHSIVYC